LETFKKSAGLNSKTDKIIYDKKWWRRRESNPRPVMFHKGVYIFIPSFKFRLFKSPSGRILERLSCKISPIL